MLHHILDNWNSITKYNDKNNAVAKQCPHILGDPRHYSLAGTSAMLPLSYSGGKFRVEILVCHSAKLGVFFCTTLIQLDCSSTCLES
jgi:hypothetical protein